MLTKYVFAALAASVCVFALGSDEANVPLIEGNGQLRIGSTALDFESAAVDSPIEGGLLISPEKDDTPGNLKIKLLSGKIKTSKNKQGYYVIKAAPDVEFSFAKIGPVGKDGQLSFTGELKFGDPLPETTITGTLTISPDRKSVHLHVDDKLPLGDLSKFWRNYFRTNGEGDVFASLSLDMNFKLPKGLIPKDYRWRGDTIVHVEPSKGMKKVEPSIANHMKEKELNPKDARLIWVGQGKGSRVGWDLATVAELEERFPGLMDKTIFSANSGSAFVAAYFACHGVNRQTLAAAEKLMKEEFDPSIIDEKVAEKSVGFALTSLADSLAKRKPILDQNIDKEMTRAKHESLKKVIDGITDNGTCVPKRPLILTALNLHVLSPPESAEEYKNPSKHLDQDTLRVTDRSGRSVGQFCTDFVTESMYEIMKSLPRRKCDLYVMRTGADLVKALLSGASEPTYLPPFKWGSPMDITTPDNRVVTVSNPVFRGGIAQPGGNTAPILALPNLPSVGSGRPPYDWRVVTFLKTQYQLSVNSAVEKAKKEIKFNIPLDFNTLYQLENPPLGKSNTENFEEQMQLARKATRTISDPLGAILESGQLQEAASALTPSRADDSNYQIKRLP